MKLKYKLETESMSDDKVVVNVGKHGGYVMIESIDGTALWDKRVLITALDDIGNVVFEQELDLSVNDIDVTTLTEGESR